MRRLVFAFLWALLCATALFAQNTTALAPQALPGLNVQVRGGTILLANSSIGISNTTVALSNNTTNYVFLSSAGVVQTNTTGFTSTVLPIATVLTAQGQIVDIQDNRPDYIFTGGGSGLPAGLTNNTLPKSTGTSLANSSCTDNGTTVSCSEPVSSTGAVTTGTGCTPAGATASGGICMTESTSTGWTPTAGFDYQRADSATHKFVCSSNGGAEGSCSSSLLSSINGATGSNTIDNGNNVQAWNWTQTSNSQNVFGFGETLASTNGTLTSGLANQGILNVFTKVGSTATPFSVTQGSVTGTTAFPMAQFQTTWNNGSLVGQGLVVSVTNTASAAGSQPFNILVGGTSQFSVDKVGTITTLGNFALSGAAAASVAPFTLTGTLFTGGTGTTTIPYAYINQSVSAPSTWSTTGTIFGMNAPSGFGSPGNFMDFHINGGNSLASIRGDGRVTGASLATAAGGAVLADKYTYGSGITWSSSTAATIQTHFNTSGDSITSNGSASFVITTGTGTGTSTGAVTLGTASTGWTCFITNQTRAALVLQTATTTSVVTFTNFGTTFAATNWTNGDTLNVTCTAH